MGLLEDLETVDLIVLDVETKMVPTFTGKDLFGVAIGIPTGLGVKAYYVKPEDLHLYKARLNQVDIVAHNVLFDSEIMRQNDCPLDGFWWDTMVMAHLANENEQNFGLDALAKRYLGRGKTSMKAKTCSSSKTRAAGASPRTAPRACCVRGWTTLPTAFATAR